jgi:cell wall-associated NlpC family hydrolase
MSTGWRHWAAVGGRRLAVLGVVAVVGALGAAAMASDGAATQAAVRPKSVVAPGGGRLPSARNPSAGRAAALARSTARDATLSVALSGLRTQGEVLTERYDHEVSLEQQAAAAYQVAAARFAAARKRQQRAAAQLAQQAAADYESEGGQSLAVVLFEGITDPQGYLGTLGLQQTLDNRRVDLLAASKGDEIVTRLFSAQAASLLGQQRSAAQAADFLKAAVVAAVNRQAAVVKAAKASRSRLAAASTAETRAEMRAAQTSADPLSAEGGSATPPPGIAASVLAGGPSGAAPGVVAPDWAPDAGASAAQGNIAANWALTQLGQPYQWGTAGPDSYDCSGLALQAWARAGVRLLHWSGFQWVSGPHVPLVDLRRGDLVFFATNSANPATVHHVGIYIGNGLMVDAPYTGAFVRIDPIYAFAGLIGFTRPAA